MPKEPIEMPESNPLPTLVTRRTLLRHMAVLPAALPLLSAERADAAPVPVSSVASGTPPVRVRSWNTLTNEWSRPSPIATLSAAAPHPPVRVTVQREAVPSGNGGGDRALRGIDALYPLPDPEAGADGFVPYIAWTAARPGTPDVSARFTLNPDAAGLLHLVVWDGAGNGYRVTLPSPPPADGSGDGTTLHQIGVPSALGTNGMDSVRVTLCAAPASDDPAA